MSRKIHPQLQLWLSQCSSLRSGLPEKSLGELNAMFWQLEMEKDELKQNLMASAQELHETNIEMQTVLRAIPDMFLRLDASGQVLYYYGSYEIDHLFPQNIVGLRLDDVKTKEVAEQLVSTFEEVHTQRCPLRVEYSTERFGERQYYEANFNLLPSDNIILAIRNITDRKLAEIQLKQAHSETETLLASISSILIGVNSDDMVTRWNKAAENTFGITLEQVIAKPFIECGIDWDWPHVLENIAVSRDRDTPSPLEDVRFTKPDNKDGFLTLIVNPVVGNKREHKGYLLLGSDITERKILEQHLAQAQKLESIGQLAAGIAHEINTPTQYVGDNVSFLEKAFARLSDFVAECAKLYEADEGEVQPSVVAELRETWEKSRVKYLLEEIPFAIKETLQGVDRIGAIVMAMKEYSHPGGDEMTAIDINKALKSTLLVSRNEWKYYAEVETHYNAAMPAVPCYPSELNQVFLNVIVNAAHAIMDANERLGRDKGLITVTTDYDLNHAYIKISDTGTGIPEPFQNRIFDPFFTSKEVGKGTGQGLAISHSVIVEKHGGKISFDTEIGKGTTFVIRLPLQPEGVTVVKEDDE